MGDFTPIAILPQTPIYYLFIVNIYIFFNLFTAKNQSIKAPCRFPKLGNERNSENHLIKTFSIYILYMINYTINILAKIYFNLIKIVNYQTLGMVAPPPFVSPW